MTMPTGLLSWASPFNLHVFSIPENLAQEIEQLFVCPTLGEHLEGSSVDVIVLILSVLLLQLVDEELQLLL
jgi:hypothetical protein